MAVVASASEENCTYQSPVAIHLGLSSHTAFSTFNLEITCISVTEDTTLEPTPETAEKHHYGMLFAQHCTIAERVHLTGLNLLGEKFEQVPHSYPQSPPQQNIERG